MLDPGDPPGTAGGAAAYAPGETARADPQTRVALAGLHFRNYSDAFCTFGAAHAPAVFVSATELACRAPQSPAAAGDLPRRLFGDEAATEPADGAA